MTKGVFGFGEILMRLSTLDHQRLVQARQMEANYGGSEVNVLISLSNFGMDTAFISAVPNHPLGQAPINELRRYGVNTDHVLRNGDRLGLYFLEPGASVRASKVIYDRKRSSFAQVALSDYEIEDILSKASWFHTTGITPALSKNCFDLTKAFLRSAKEKGIPTSMDWNYRAKLWDKATAKKAFYTLAEEVDVCLGIDLFAEDIIREDEAFTKHKEDYFTAGRLNPNGFERIFKEMKKRFGFKYICSTSRNQKSASQNELYGLLYAEDQLFVSKAYQLEIVDRVGGGDAFSAGLTYGLNQEWPFQKQIEFAVAASALKHSIPGDFNHASLEEVFEVMNGNTWGRLQR